MTFSDSLSYQVSKKVLLSYFLITLVITLVQVFFEYKDIKQRVKADLVKLEETFKPSLRQAIWDLNQPQVDILTQSIYQLTFVKKIEVKDASNIIIHQSDSAKLKHEFSHEFDIHHNYQGKVLLLGTVSIYSDRGVVVDQLKFGFLLIVVGAMIKSLILVMLFLWAFRKYLTQPLNEFVHQLGDIKYANWGQNKAELHTRKGNELDYLKVEFNKMVSAVDKQKQLVEKMNLQHQLDMEKEVERRTEQLEKANAELSYLASTDFLTKVNNRRSFYDLGQQYFSMSKRNGFSLVVLMMDLDHFKNVNDRYGHEMGDLVLRKFAQSANALLRESDIFGRIGGEEFSVVMMDIATEEAKKVAERILKQTQELCCEASGEVKDLNITVSIGLATITPNDTSIDCVLSKADKAVYEAKKQGRNQLVVYHADFASEE